MRTKDGFVLRRVPGMNLVMPTGKNVKDFSGALMLNDTGAFIFEKLQKGATAEETARALTQAYNVSAEDNQLADRSGRGGGIRRRY